MPAPRSRRVLLRALAATVTGSIVLGLFPPVVAETEAPVVNRSVRLSFDEIVPDRAAGSRQGPGVATTDRAWTRPATACLPGGFTMVGVTWRQTGSEEVPARLAWGPRDALGASVPLVADPSEGPDPRSPDDGGIVGTPLRWVGEAECVRFRLRLEGGERYRDLRAALIDTSGPEEDSPLASVGSALGRLWGMVSPAPAAAMSAKPSIIRRPQWGANESWRYKYCDGEPDYAPALKMSHVHHTAGSNDYSFEEADDVVRGVYSYHVNSLHYCDIAYNFLIDKFGRIYEGRYGGMAKPVIGGHASGFNTGSTGISVMGDYSTKVPSSAVRSAYKRLLAWRLDVAHLPPKGRSKMVSSGGSTARYEEGEEVWLRIVSGHRDTSYTACPGTELYARLAGIRNGASNRGGPKIWKPRQTKSHLEPGQKVRWVADLSDTLDWSIEVVNAGGTVIRRFTGTSGGIDRKWFGKDKQGLPVPAGAYTVRMKAQLSADKVARPATFTLTIV